MGAKDSKPSFIQYEDAVRRVSDSEVRRIRDAYKACSGSGGGGTLSAEAFSRDVLCSWVPPAVAEWLYAACGGTRRGITFRDLLCGIVVLTKGSVDEKIKFLWTLYVNNQTDSGIYIYKWDFLRALHLEKSSLPLTVVAGPADILTGLFGSGDRASFEQFRSWLLIHKDATVLSTWLLADQCSNTAADLETPTFYQSLAGVTHLEERDIVELEKCFWSLRNAAPSGQLDVDSLTPLLSPPLPRAAVPGVFLAFDENRDGHVDFKELCCGLSAACRGPRTERLKFCFKIFDMDRDGILNHQELIDMISILTRIANESLKNQTSRSSTPTDNEQYAVDKPFDPDIVLETLRDKISNTKDETLKPIFQLGSKGDQLESKDTNTEQTKNIMSSSEDEGGGEIIDYNMVLTQEDFLIWSVETAESLVTPFMDLIFEVCHIVLGLRPHCKHQERDIVLGWLWRETRRGYTVGQFWYLVSADWWSTWLAYTSGPDTCCRANKHIDEAIVCDESFTSNSTEEGGTEYMGSLLGRADTVSLASAASSSGVSSGVSGGSSRNNTRSPAHIDNKRLIAPNPYKVRTLTGEGGHLRRDITLAQHRDFELLPDALWRALALWYGGVQPLPRQVIRPPNSEVELELYPLNLRILRHVPSAQRLNAGSGVTGMPMYGGVMVAPAPLAPPPRQLAYTAAFSRLATVKQMLEFLCLALGLAREDVRLWQVGGSAAGDACVCLLDDERPSLAELRFEDNQRVLLEVRNRDLTWPEEIGALSLTSASVTERRGTLLAPNLPGATGLHNLGNTCFMNAALQAVWNTGPLTRYFNSGVHLYEVNVDNPLGTKGALAMRYGELCKEVWSCSARSVAPLRVRWCVARHAPHLAGGGQHDAQEMLAWLLDALHEDLNRAAAHGPPAAHDDSRGRPDQVVAGEAWESHTTRNKSIMTDLFYGQLKSKVRCDMCGHESVRFDAFNMLSLPLPMESYVHCEIRVILLDGSVPVKYGIRVSSEGLYADVKERLSQLCGISPGRLLLVELSGSSVPVTLDDKSRVRGTTAGELYAYQLPLEMELCVTQEHESSVTTPVAAADSGAAAEVSRRTQTTSSLCMPALFCFKRSKSEILMSQSPPNTFYTNKHGKEEVAYKSEPIQEKFNTLPKETPSRGSPTLSVKSLNIKMEGNHLKRLKSSPSEMNKMEEQDVEPLARMRYLVAVHRKQCRADTYFLPQHRSRSVLFGVPLLVPLREGATGRELYASVWSQVERLLSVSPPAPPDQANHATDCDDSLGYAFPFTLRAVAAPGAAACALCAWSSLCRGCVLPCDDNPLVVYVDGSKGARPSECGGTAPACPGPMSDKDSPIAKAKHNRYYAREDIDDGVETKPPARCELSTLDMRKFRSTLNRGPTLMLAIDWDPTALHLRYQSTRERACVEHESVGECAAAGARPVDLAHCLSAFTAEEKLEQPYHCSGCRSAQPATKKLQIWRLPPILIIHLKRFQYVNNKWIKSQKVVNFPFENFDPTAFLASVPQETILRHHELKSMFRRRSSMFTPEISHSHISESENSDDEEREETRKAEPKLSEMRTKIDRSKRRESIDKVKTRQRLVSTSLVTTPVTDDNLVDYHKHNLKREEDPFDLKYRLYAVVSHSGQMSGGHYVTYARNPTGAWLCYNDSSCRELSLLQRAGAEPVPPVDPSAAYLLFYERQGLDCEQYLPETSGREPVLRPFENIDGDDSDLKKMCVIS